MSTRTIGIPLAIILVLALGLLGWRFQWFSYGGDATPTPTLEGEPSGTLPITPTAPQVIASPRSAPLYTGAPVQELHADSSMIAQVKPATYEASRKELADLATKLAVDPLQPELWKRVAYIKHFYNDDLGARDAYEYLNRIAPNDALGFYNLGVLYGYHLKEPAKATPKYETAIRLNPLNASFYTGYAAFQREVLNNSTAAEKTLLLGYAKVPSDVSLVSSIAAFYRDQGNTVKAIEFYEKTLASNDLSSGERVAIQAELDRLKAK